MVITKLFWKSRLQTVQLPKALPSAARVRRMKMAVISKPVTNDWAWLDGPCAEIDEDFERAVLEARQRP